MNAFNVIKIDINGIYSNSSRNEDIVPLFTESVREELMEEFPSCGIKADLAPVLALVYLTGGVAHRTQ